MQLQWQEDHEQSQQDSYAELISPRLHVLILS